MVNRILIIGLVSLMLVGSLAWTSAKGSVITWVDVSPFDRVIEGTTVVTVTIVTDTGTYESDPRLHCAELANKAGFDVNGNKYGQPPNPLVIPVDITGLAVDTYTIHARINYTPVSEMTFTLAIEQGPLEIVNVKDYGAKGDADTNPNNDDTTAIQSAINSLSSRGGMVVLPKGTYNHTSVLTLVNNITIMGYGATIKCKGSTDKSVGGLSANGKSNIVIMGLTYDGNRANRLPSSPVGSAHGINYTNITDFSFQDVIVKNCVADGIMLAYSVPTDATTRCFRGVGERIRCTNNFRNGLSVVGAKDVTFIGSRFDNTNGTAPQSGVDCEADNAATKPENITFVGCTFDNNATTGLYFSTNTYNSHAVSCNFANNPEAGIYFGATTTQYCSVSDSLFESNGKGAVLNGTACVIEGCTFKNNTTQAIGTNGANTYCKIIGNDSVGGSDYGFEIRGTNNTVMDNIIRDVTSTIGWHLYLSGGSQIVDNNIIESSLGSLGAQGLRDDSLYSILIGNRVTGCKDYSGINTPQILAIPANFNVCLGNWDGTIGREVTYQGDMRLDFNTAAPTSGTWNLGDRVLNTTPSSGNYSGWICVTSGTPGTWVGFGNANLTGTATWDPPSIANGAAAGTTVTVSGAAVGDTVVTTFDQMGANNVLISGHVQAANTVRVVLNNHTGGSINLVSGTVRVDVWKH